MPRQNPLDAVESVVKDLTKEGNAVARTRALPSGRNADKGYDVDSFNAGMRYAMQKVNTGIKQIRAGTFKPSDTAKKAPAKAAAKRTAKTPAKRAPAKRVAKKAAPATVTDIDTARAKTKVVRRRVAAQ